MRRSRRSLLAAMAVTGTAGCLRLQEGTGSASTQTDDSTSNGVEDDAETTGGDSDESGSQPGGDGARAGLYAFDAESGERAWLHETTPNGWETRIDYVTTGNGQVYYTTDSTGSGSEQQPAVRALDPDSGEVQWEYEPEEGFFAGIAHYDDELWVSMVDGTFVLDAATGDRLREVGYATGFEGFRRDGDTLYFVRDEGSAVDLETGNELWHRTLDRESNNRPVVSGETLYFGTEAGYVVALDATDGTGLWESRVDGSIQNDFAVGDGVLWVVDESATLYGFDRSSGEEVYRRSEGVEDRQPVALGDLLYMYEDGERSVYEVSGGSSVTLSKQRTLPASPNFATDEYFVSGGNWLRTMDAQGNTHWESERTDDDHFGGDGALATVFGDEYVFYGTTGRDQ